MCVARAVSSAIELIEDFNSEHYPKIKAAIYEQHCVERLGCELEARGYTNYVRFFK
jgi:hypothetical protein